MAAFNRQQFAALACAHDLHILVAQPWLSRGSDWLSCRQSTPVAITSGPAVTYKNFYYVPKLLRVWQGHFFLRSLRSTALRLADSFNPDVLLGCWAYPDGWAAVKLGREFGLPVVVKVHGSDVLVVGRDPARRHLIAETLCQANRVVAVSENLAEHVVGLGVAADRVHVVRNGVDTELFRPLDRDASREGLDLPRDGKIVLFVGNILLSKGAGVLVEACAALRRRGVEFSCYLVGSGRDAARVRSLIARHGLQNTVVLVGQRSHAALPSWYAACDAVALPSFSEGIPNVLQEAIACHRPFVASEVGGIPEIAHPSQSRLVPAGDVQKFADALEAILSLPRQSPLDFTHSCAGDWQSSADALADVLGAAVRQHQLKSPTHPILTT